MRMLKNYHPIIIVLDRERRTQGIDELTAELLPRLCDQNPCAKSLSPRDMILQG